MNHSEQTFAGTDETIGQVDKLYRAVTGSDAPSPEPAYAPIPAETDPAQHVEEQLNRLLEVLGQVGSGPAPAPSWMPPVSVWESDTEIVICADLPGLRRDQVEVVTEGGAITVSGTRPPARDGFRLRSSESPLGSFRRTLMVPGILRGAEPSAQMKDGVLEIRFQKQAQSATPKPVPVH